MVGNTVAGRDWEHLAVQHPYFLRGPVAAAVLVFSATRPAPSRRIPEAYRARVEGAMVMTLDARGASRRTRDPETDPRSFFQSPIQVKRTTFHGDLDARSLWSIPFFPSPPSRPRVSLSGSILLQFPPRLSLRGGRDDSYRHARNEIRETMVLVPTVLDLRTLRSLEVNPLWGIVLTAPADPSTRKQFPSSSCGRF